MPRSVALCTAVRTLNGAQRRCFAVPHSRSGQQRANRSSAACTASWRACTRKRREVEMDHCGRVAAFVTLPFGVPAPLEHRADLIEPQRSKWHRLSPAPGAAVTRSPCAFAVHAVVGYRRVRPRKACGTVPLVVSNLRVLREMAGAAADDANAPLCATPLLHPMQPQPASRSGGALSGRIRPDPAVSEVCESARVPMPSAGPF